MTRVPGLIALAVMLLAACLSGQELRQTYSALGAIDWSRRSLYTVGTTTAAADSISPTTHYAIIERARQRALDQMLMLVNRIVMNGDSTAADLLSGDGAALSALNEAAQRYTIDAVSRMAANAVSVAIHLDLEPDIAAALLPQGRAAGKLRLSDRPLCPLCGRPWPRDKPVPPNVQLIPPRTPADSTRIIFTGLIVQAGPEVVPGLAPRIRDSEGRRVYDLGFADREQAAVSGLVAYAREIAARERDRLGERPYRVQALSAAGPHRSDIIISAADAGIIHAAAAHYDFLADCRVVVLLAP